MTPKRLTGKEFEDAIMFRGRKLEEKGVLSIDRYGVQVSLFNGVWTPIGSFPDFHGCCENASRTKLRTFNIEAKACSGASYPIAGEYKKKPRQINFMVKRSRFGQSGWLLIHFNEKVMKTKVHEPFTVAVEIGVGMPVWESLEAGELKSLNRDMARDYGHVIEWAPLPGGRKETPEFEKLYI